MTPQVAVVRAGDTRGMKEEWRVGGKPRESWEERRMTAAFRAEEACLSVARTELRNMRERDQRARSAAARVARSRRSVGQTHSPDATRSHLHASSEFFKAAAATTHAAPPVVFVSGLPEASGHYEAAALSCGARVWATGRREDRLMHVSPGGVANFVLASPPLQRRGDLAEYRASEAFVGRSATHVSFAVYEAEATEDVAAGEGAADAVVAAGAEDGGGGGDGAGLACGAFVAMFAVPKDGVAVDAAGVQRFEGTFDAAVLVGHSEPPSVRPATVHASTTRLRGAAEGWDALEVPAAVRRAAGGEEEQERYSRLAETYQGFPIWLAEQHHARGGFVLSCDGVRWLWCPRTTLLSDYTLSVGPDDPVFATRQPHCGRRPDHPDLQYVSLVSFGSADASSGADAPPPPPPSLRWLEEETGPQPVIHVKGVEFRLLPAPDAGEQAEAELPAARGLHAAHKGSPVYVAAQHETQGGFVLSPDGSRWLVVTEGHAVFSDHTVAGVGAVLEDGGALLYLSEGADAAAARTPDDPRVRYTPLLLGVRDAMVAEFFVRAANVPLAITTAVAAGVAAGNEGVGGARGVSVGAASVVGSSDAAARGALVFCRDGGGEAATAEGVSASPQRKKPRPRGNIAYVTRASLTKEAARELFATLTLRAEGLFLTYLAARPAAAAAAPRPSLDGTLRGLVERLASEFSGRPHAAPPLWGVAQFFHRLSDGDDDAAVAALSRAIADEARGGAGASTGLPLTAAYTCAEMFVAFFLPVLLGAGEARARLEASWDPEGGGAGSVGSGRTMKNVTREMLRWQQTPECFDVALLAHDAARLAASRPAHAVVAAPVVAALGGQRRRLGDGGGGSVSVLTTRYVNLDGVLWALRGGTGEKPRREESCYLLPPMVLRLERQEARLPLSAVEVGSLQAALEGSNTTPSLASPRWVVPFLHVEGGGPHAFVLECPRAGSGFDAELAVSSLKKALKRLPSKALATVVFFGDEGCREVACLEECDSVLAKLEASDVWAAFEAGCRGDGMERGVVGALRVACGRQGAAAAAATRLAGVHLAVSAAPSCGGDGAASAETSPPRDRLALSLLPSLVKRCTGPVSCCVLSPAPCPLNVRFFKTLADETGGSYVAAGASHFS